VVYPPHCRWGSEEGITLIASYWRIFLCSYFCHTWQKPRFNECFANQCTNVAFATSDIGMCLL